MNAQRRRNMPVFLCAAVLALLVLPARADRVVRRGGAPTLEGRVLVLDDSGVHFRTETGAASVVTWDRVRYVWMERPDPRLDQYIELAEELWRARSRLQRRDAALAEPLFERLFERYRGQTNETALIVTEGLLRCRLARGANELAIIPALEVARMNAAGVNTDAYSALPTVIEHEYGLCTGLPPVWAPGGLLNVLERELSAYDAQGDETIAALADMYRRAVQRTLSMDENATIEMPPTEHPGLALMHRLDEVQRGTLAERRDARAYLDARLDDLPGWAQAWCRYAIGVSFLQETDLQRQQLGLVHLAHVPARHRHDQPYLTGLALWRMADVLDEQGDTTGAAELRAELRRLYPGHPVNQHLTAAAAVTCMPQECA